MGLFTMLQVAAFYLFGYETKEEKQAKKEAEQKMFGTMQKVEKPASKEEKEEKERIFRDPNEDFKYVCEGATVLCKYHAGGEVKMKSTSTPVMLQDKSYMTNGDMNGKANFDFTSICTHSSHGSKKPPCIAVVCLGKWINVSDTFVDNYNPLLVKSTIKCGISNDTLKITNSGQKASVADMDIMPSSLEIKILKIDTKHFTPLGIQNPIDKSFKSDSEIKIKYEIKKEDASRLTFKVYSEDGEVLYSMNYLPEVTVNVKKNSDSNPTIKQTESRNKEDITSIGKHILEWDGFNVEGILDTSKLLGKLTFELIATDKKGLTSKPASKEVKTRPIVKKAQWVKAIITNTDHKKNIDVSFNVNLKDGGAKGVTSKPPIIITGSSSLPNSPFPIVPIGSYTPGDWDEVPKEERIKIGEEPIKTRVTSFEELVKLALEGIKTYWSRNGSRDNGITVDSVNFKVNTEAVNTNKKSPYSLDDIPLIFNTNGDWGRSGNPGANYGDNSDVPIIKTIDDGLIQQITYNVGYIKYSEWGYEKIDNANADFRHTAAHELGHEILQAFGSTVYSWQHKGSSYYLPQDTKPVKPNFFHWEVDFMPDTTGEDYPKEGEQDLMKYYNGKGFSYLRNVAAEEDVKGLIWLTGIKIIQ